MGSSALYAIQSRDMGQIALFCPELVENASALNPYRCLSSCELRINPPYVGVDRTNPAAYWPAVSAFMATLAPLQRPTDTPHSEAMLRQLRSHLGLELPVVEGSLTFSITRAKPPHTVLFSQKLWDLI